MRTIKFCSIASRYFLCFQLSYCELFSFTITRAKAKSEHILIQLLQIQSETWKIKEIVLQRLSVILFNEVRVEDVEEVSIEKGTSYEIKSIERRTD